MKKVWSTGQKMMNIPQLMVAKKKMKIKERKAPLLIHKIKMVIYCKLSLISPSAYKTPSFQTHLINCKHPVISPLLYPQIYYNVLNAQGLKAVVYGIGVKLTEKNKANYRLYSSETYNESI